MARRDLPNSLASTVETGADTRLFAPSAARNIGPLSDLLAQYAPADGSALELASGTGQHVVAYAARLPGLHWQPSEIDATRRASIDAHVTASRASNIAPAIALDATRRGWSAEQTGQALIVLSNLLHLISGSEAQTVLREAAMALAPEGRIIVYGPFMRSGRLTSVGDQSFHDQLTAQDPDIGYKDDTWALALLCEAGLENPRVVEMPANNLALMADRPAT